MKNYIFKKIYTSLVRGSVVFQHRQFPSSLLQAQQNKDSTPDYLQPRTQAPPLPSSLLEGFFPWRSWTSVFLILSPTTCCWMTAVVGNLPFFQPVPTHGIEALLWGQWTEITRPVMALSPAHTMLFPHQERQTKRNSVHHHLFIRNSDPRSTCVT